jgi:hypothetical protein
MSEKPFTLAADEKATQVMIGTRDTLLWGNLVTKQQVRMSIYMNTLAEDFVPLRETKALFLAPAQQMAPIERPAVHVKQEEVLLFFAMVDSEPLPDETETRRYAPIEAFIGSYRIEGKLLKSPVATIENMLLVSKSTYLPIYQATVRHVAKPWLGTFTSPRVHVRQDQMILVEPPE